MITQCRFDFLETKDDEVRFDGGLISTDAGLSVFIEWMNTESMIEPYAEVLKISDERASDRIDHTMQQMLCQRVV